MKAILEFDLDEHEDRLAHKRAISATDVYLALHDIDNEFRKMIKYDSTIGMDQKLALIDGYHVITGEEAILLHQIVSGIRSSFNRILEDRGINLEDLE